MTGALVAFASTARSLVSAAAFPALCFAVGVGFPLFVLGNPDRFGAQRMASPIEGLPAPGPAEPRGRIMRAWADSVPPGVDPIVTGAVEVSDPPPVENSAADDVPARVATRAFRVIGFAGEAVLVVHHRGAEIVRRGELLPDGRRLLRAHPNGRIETDPAE